MSAITMTKKVDGFRTSVARTMAMLAVVLAMICAIATQPSLAVEHTIEIKSLKFVPAELTVRLGDKVTWINRDIAPHTATANDKSWDTKRLKKGEAMSLVVTAEMKADYFCRFHPNMKARLVIAPVKQ